MRKRTFVIVLAILSLGLTGMALSSQYQQSNELIWTPFPTVIKASFGFPLSWHGYSEQIVGLDGTRIPWYSVEFLLIDTAFWFAISLFVCIATMKSVNLVQRTKVSKTPSVINIRN
jgi:hypothetical protein